MFLSDRASAYIRTLWPLLLGHAAAWLLLKVDALGLPVDNTLVVELVSFAAAAVVYGTGRFLESRTGGGWLPILARGLGKWVLALGLHTGQPTYRHPVWGYDRE